ncbi:unnamed protein product [Rotaria magnacalcarata]|uniref:EF-hand domain-containing protein n=1 Tax=Rotaria magnacalcarata TaxID=392030 RepID=A0A816DJP0_9BILA|nr:unnamed protein product [Rotaria magnacalcarata]CAF1636889.1 unnamed protein product [Rotaria magnacalcarata]CAF2086510.1 unnamed protein product [Rotaria magnacalcarata]CAF2142366.1 unnamed protein product [Rotaria magnacalcarata]CAF2260016.1 unnamed protein product [Rotaria magnacalcarata]
MTYSSSSSSYSHSYQYDYQFSFTSQSGQLDTRSTSLPRDCYDRYSSYEPRCAISEQNFMEVVEVIMMGSNADDCDIHRAFDILDADASGTIDVRELAKVIPAIMPGTTCDTLSSIIRRYDKNCDNKLNVNEFTRLVKGDLGRDLVYRDVLMIE